LVDEIINNGYSYDCTLLSHTSYAMQTNHHHTYESPKHYYSTQLSHIFNNDNTVFPCPSITTANIFFPRASCVIGQAHITYLSCHLFHTQRAPNRLQVTPLWPLVAPQCLFPRVHLSFTGMVSFAEHGPEFCLVPRKVNPW